MKNIKKLTLITLLSTGVIFTTACSQSGNQSTENKTEQKQDVKLSNEAVIKKVQEVMSSAKSIERTTISKSNDSIHGEGSQENTLQIIKDPFIIKAMLKFNVQEKSFGSEEYIKDGIRYINSSNNWSKSKLPDERVNAEKEIFTNPLKEITKYGKDYTVAENDKEYIIEFNPSDLKLLLTQLNESDKTLDKDKSSYTSYKLKYIVDKSTFKLISKEVNYTSNFVRTINGQTQAFDETLASTTTYKYDTLSTIELPEAAKNAREL